MRKCENEILFANNLDRWDDEAEYLSKCGTTSDENILMLINPNYPDGYSKGIVCNYYVGKSHKHVSQLRIEFIQFNLAPPNGGMK